MSEPFVDVKRLPHGRGLPLPAYATAGAAGLDLRAAVEAPTELAAGERLVVPTGLAVSIPNGYEGQVRSRSGLAALYGLAVLNAPGTIDADYRGEIKICLFNIGAQPFTIERGMRVAQLVICPVAKARLREVEELGDTPRMEGGFSSTGLD